MKYVVSCMIVQQWFYVQALNLRWWQLDIKLLTKVNKYGRAWRLQSYYIRNYFYDIINTSWYHETFSDNIQNVGKYLHMPAIYLFIDFRIEQQNSTIKSRIIIIFIILMVLKKVFVILNRNIFILKCLIRFSPTQSSCQACRNITRRLSE